MVQRRLEGVNGGEEAVVQEGLREQVMGLLAVYERETSNGLSLDLKVAREKIESVFSELKRDGLVENASGDFEHSMGRTFLRFQLTSEGRRVVNAVRAKTQGVQDGVIEDVGNVEMRAEEDL